MVKNVVFFGGVNSVLDVLGGYFLWGLTVYLMYLEGLFFESSLVYVYFILDT
jgi:hypothetical protein